MKTFNWRLGKLPTPLEVVDLVNHKIITQDEARKILFSEETQEDRDKKSLESEIKFLRTLVDKLSDNRKIVQTIHEVITPSITKWNWYQPYQNWAASIPSTPTNYGASTTNLVHRNSNVLGSQSSNNTVNASVVGNSTAQLSTIGKNFSEIETF